MDYETVATLLQRECRYLAVEQKLVKTVSDFKKCKVKVLLVTFTYPHYTQIMFTD